MECTVASVDLQPTAGWRARSVQATWEWLQPLLPRVGITRVANITGLDKIGIPIWMAVRPLSRALSTSQGKGVNNVAAKVGAVMESIECWHAEQYHPSLVYESLLRLGGRHTIDLSSFTIVAGSAIRRDAPMLWAEGISLISGERVLVPWECVSLNTVAGGMLRKTFAMSSTGLAGGNTRDEAVLHALLEIVERHSISVWRGLDKAETKATQVDPAIIADELLQKLLARVAAHALVGLWEITAVPGVPAAACLLVDPATEGFFQPIGTCIGYAADLEFASAARRALLEAVQARCTMIAGSRDDLGFGEFSDCRDPRFVDNVRAEISFPPPTRIVDESPIAPRSVAERLAHVQRCLGSAGVSEVVEFDLSRSEIGVPVVKLVVPGLDSPLV